MSIFQQLSYLWRAFRNDPNRDFFSEGLGIEARFRRVGSYWRPHLRLSKEFQTDSIARYVPDWKSLTIFGAGRLLDLPQEFLAQAPGKSISLVDADSGCIPTWKRFQSKCRSSGVTVNFEQGDITGKFQAWTGALIAAIEQRGLSTGDRTAAAGFVENLAAIDLPLPKLPRADVVVSLNLLGQLAVYWRQRIENLLRPYLITFDKPRDDKLDQAITTLCARLEQEHLRLLSNLDARLVIMLHDDEYYYYKNDRAEWQVEAALHGDISGGLKNYSRVASDSWLWHLAPQGKESREYGEIHRVQARAYVRP